MKYPVIVRKEIKSFIDLPTKNDRYAVHSKGAGLNDLHDSTWMRLYKDSWLRDYDYYLQPLELDLPDDEELHELDLFHYFGARLLRDKIKNQLK